MAFHRHKPDHDDDDDYFDEAIKKPSRTDFMRTSNLLCSKTDNEDPLDAFMK